MAVDLVDIPPEGTPLFGERFEGHGLLGLAAHGDLVPVNDAHESSELEVSRAHGGFPDLSLLALTVTHEAEDPGRHPVEPGGQASSGVCG